MCLCLKTVYPLWHAKNVKTNKKWSKTENYLKPYTNVIVSIGKTRAFLLFKIVTFFLHKTFKLFYFY